MFGFLMEHYLAKANINGETCALWHLPSDPANEHPAVDYLCHQMGEILPDGTAEPDAELRIPICADCVDALLSNEWVLIYCINCGDSRWSCKALSDHDWPEDIQIAALKSCPSCYYGEPPEEV